MTGDLDQTRCVTPCCACRCRRIASHQRRNLLAKSPYRSQRLRYHRSSRGASWALNNFEGIVDTREPGADRATTWNLKRYFDGRVEIVPPFNPVQRSANR